MSQLIQSIKTWIEEPDYKDHDDHQSAFYLQVVALLMIFGAAAIGFSYTLAKQWNYVILIAIDIFVNYAILLMIRQKLLKPAVNLFIVFTLAFLTFSILSVGGIHALISVLYPVVIIFASLLLDRKSFIAYCMLCVSSVGLIVFAENHHISPPYIPDPPQFPLFFAFSLMILGSAVLIRFITESLQDNLRKTRQHEQELATQKEILDRVGQAVVACLPDNTIFYWNKAASSFYGWPVEEAMGKKYNDLVPASASLETLEAISTDLRTGNVWSGELLIQKHDGTFLPTISTLAPLHDKDGKMGGWVGIAADLSERKQVEETLRESEDRFKSVFDYSVIGNSVTRLTGEVQVNRAFCETVGYSPEELQQRRWQEITHPDDIELTQKEIDSLISGEKEVARFTKRFIHKNGSVVWVDLSSSLRRDKDGKPLYLMSSLVDITGQKQAEAFRVQAEIDLRTAAMRQNLFDFSRDLLSTVNLIEIFQIIRRATSEFAPHDIFRPFWLDEVTGVLLPANEQFSNVISPKWVIPPGQGILGDVIAKQQAECVNNSHLDPRSIYPSGARAQILHEHGIFIPIRDGEKTIGALTLLRRTLPAGFTQDEFELMQLLMSVAELALRNAHMFAELEQRVAERTAQLAASEERYRLISTVSSDYMFSSRLNDQGQLALDWAAGAFENITGYTFDEYVTRGGWLAALYPEDLEQDAQDMAALQANRPVTTEVRTIAKNGQVRWARVYAHPLWDEGKNQLVGIYGGVQDITAHKQAEIREKYRRTMLEKVVNLGKKIAGLSNLRDCLLEIRQSIQHELGFDRVSIFLYDAKNGQVQGTFGTDGAGNPEDISNYIETISEGDAWNIALKNPNGMYLVNDTGKQNRKIAGHRTRMVKEHLTVSAWSGDTPVALITTDNLLTQRKMSEEQIEALQLFAGYIGLAIQNARWNEELEKHVEKRTAELESANLELESLSYTIGHDLRSPIRAIVAYSHMLLEDLSGKLDKSHEDKLQQVNQVSLRMGCMVDNFLTFMKLGRVVVQKQPVNVKLLAERVIADLAADAARRKVDFSVLPMPDCVADFNLLKDVYFQLISNALKFAKPRSPALIEIGAIEKQGEICYFVRDNGVGFDMKHAGKLFGVFQRLHHLSEFDGIGAGLAIAQRIVQRHGGRIWAEAEVNKGAIFYFTLAPA